MAKRTKVFISKKYAKQYIAGVDNGKIIFTEKLGEAWLMFYGEWWAFTRLHSVADRYKKIEIVVRGVR